MTSRKYQNIASILNLRVLSAKNSTQFSRGAGLSVVFKMLDIFDLYCISGDRRRHGDAVFIISQLWFSNASALF